MYLAVFDALLMMLTAELCSEDAELPN